MAALTVAAMRVQRVARRRIEVRSLREQCCGVLHKQSRGRLRLPLGIEAGVWRRRFVYLTADALCYQRAHRSGEVDVSSTRLIRFSTIVSVVGQLDSRILLVHQRRDHGYAPSLAAPSLTARSGGAPSSDPAWAGGESTWRVSKASVQAHRFLLPSAEATGLWASSLLRLIVLCGFACPGSLEVGVDQLSELASSAADERHGDERLHRGPPPLEAAYGGWSAAGSFVSSSADLSDEASLVRSTVEAEVAAKEVGPIVLSDAAAVPVEAAVQPTASGDEAEPPDRDGSDGDAEAAGAVPRSQSPNAAALVRAHAMHV